MARLALLPRWRIWAGLDPASTDRDAGGASGDDLHANGSVSVRNVPATAIGRMCPWKCSGYGCFRGDIAWGGNWFFLVSDHGLPLRIENRTELLAVSTAIRAALIASGITGKDKGLIDHIELCGPASDPNNSGRNFVLCPGASFDRSPCGTGTSAKLACLYAAGELGLNEIWRQEGTWHCF